MAISQRPDKKFDIRVTASVNGQTVERRRRGIEK